VIMRYPFYTLLFVMALGIALARPPHYAAANTWESYGTSMGGQVGVSAPIGNTQVRTSTGTRINPSRNPDTIARYNYSRDSYNRNMRERYAVQSNREVGISSHFSDENVLMTEMGAHLGDIDPASGILSVTPPSARVMGGIQRGLSYND